MKIPFIKNQPLATGAGNLFPISEELMSRFTVETKFDSEPVELFKVMGDKVLVPRNCSYPGSDKRAPGATIAFESKFVPRDEEQSRIVDTSTRLLVEDQSHILQAATGKGKTIMGCEIAGRLGKKFLIIVPKSDIVDQWRKALKLVLGLTDSEIGYIQGDRCDVAGKKAVIGMVHSVCKDNRYPSWVFNEFGLVIVDEVHVISATTFHNSMWIIPAKLRLGLSATPYRADGKDFIFYAHIGPVKIRSEAANMVPKILVKKSKWQVPTIREIRVIGGRRVVSFKKLPHQAGKCTHIHKTLARSVPRNRVIAEFVFQAYQKGRRTIVFSELKESHLDGIESELIGMGIPETDIGWYVGGLSRAKLEQAKHCKIILSTYKMAAMATDIPWLDTCVLATPRSDVVQIVGRILRECDGKLAPLVFDIVDEDSEVFKGYYGKRRRWYESIGAEIVEV